MSTEDLATILMMYCIVRLWLLGYTFGRDLVE